MDFGVLIDKSIKGLMILWDYEQVFNRNKFMVYEKDDKLHMNDFGSYEEINVKDLVVQGFVKIKLVWRIQHEDQLIQDFVKNKLMWRWWWVYTPKIKFKVT